MGLAGPRKRQKISHDPNNTLWARDTTGFGHKILSQQGWKPGDFLGAEGAAHASHFTAASASHVRVTLKDDTLGIGAQRTGETAETFGLGGLADIYGRLNGKEATKEFKERQKARADVGRMLYVERRYGPSNFVSGGFLVGDKLKSLDDDEAASKAKASSQDAQDASEARDTTTKKAKKEKAEKKHRKKRVVPETGSQEAPPVVRPEAGAEVDTTADPEALDKAEKRRRKEERRERRERKRAKREAKARSSDNTSADDEDTTKSTEPVAVTASPAFGGSRQMVRRRFIQSKRMAAIDPRAMKEILMAR